MEKILSKSFDKKKSSVAFSLQKTYEKMLEIKNLCVSILENNKKILHGVNLKLKENEKIALMGPNGSGKSSLVKVIAGDPSYVVTKGDILFLSPILV